MFLTKKQIWKIAIIATCYFILGSVFLMLATLLRMIGDNSAALFILGGAVYALCPPVILSGIYSEGKGKLVNLGNKLVRNELRPAEFITQYKNLKNSTELVTCKPSIEALHLLIIAYDSLDDSENSLAVADEMIAIASEKKKTFAKLIKTSLLFSSGRIEEAEALFNEARNSKLNFLSIAMTDAILKSDRAMAMGDYQTVEFYNLKLLTQTFPKLDNLSKLIVNFQLGKVYDKMGNYEKAVPYYQYCVNFGGETAIRSTAKSALEKANGTSAFS